MDSIKFSKLNTIHDAMYIDNLINVLSNLSPLEIIKKLCTLLVNLHKH